MDPAVGDLHLGVVEDLRAPARHCHYHVVECLGPKLASEMDCLWLHPSQWPVQWELYRHGKSLVQVEVAIHCGTSEYRVALAKVLSLRTYSLQETTEDLVIGACCILGPKEVQVIDVYRNPERTVDLENAVCCRSPELTVDLEKVVYRSPEPMVDLEIAFYCRHLLLHMVQATSLGCIVPDQLFLEVGTHFHNLEVAPAVFGPSSPQP